MTRTNNFPSATRMQIIQRRKKKETSDAWKGWDGGIFKYNNLERRQATGKDLCASPR